MGGARGFRFWGLFIAKEQKALEPAKRPKGALLFAAEAAPTVEVG
jgi:hypothetical protein